MQVQKHKAGVLWAVASGCAAGLLALSMGVLQNPAAMADTGSGSGGSSASTSASTSVSVSASASTSVSSASTSVDLSGIGTSGTADNSEVNSMYALVVEQAQEYAPKVTTLADGTQIQRTPTDTGYFQMYYANNLSYNTYYLNADNRGCNSCHPDLAQTVKDMDFFHIELDNGYGTTVSATDCRLCHDYGYGYVDKTLEFGSLIHGIHSKDTFTGNCMSCHTATSDGNGMQLWEDARYDVMQGITKLSTDDYEADFSYDQDTLSDQMFSASWFYTDTNAENIAHQQAGDELDPDVFDNWEITVDGLVDNPFTMTLPELIAEAPSETFTSTVECIMNPDGGEQIANCEVTGIPLSWLFEKAGLQDGVTAIMSTAPDGWCRASTIENYQNKGGYLVYEVNGKRLDWDKGYPVVTWWIGQGIPANIRWVNELTAIDTPVNELKMWNGWTTGDNDDGINELNGGHLFNEDTSPDNVTYINKPNTGILHFQEGQIISADTPYTFEGYAFAWDEQVVEVAFSMDRGQTWDTYDVSDSDSNRWVYWHYTVTPQAGAYTLMVRATTDTGRVSYRPDEVFFNVK